MKILSIETTSEMASIAFLQDGDIVSEHSFKNADIAGILLEYTDNILEKSRCPVNNLDLIVVSRGPGLWTGIRLGMGVAKGLAVPFKTAIYCLETPESLFFGLKEMKVAVACVINACRGQVHFSSFAGRFNYKRRYPLKIINFNQLHMICSGKGIILTGPGIPVIPKKTRDLKTVKILSRQLLYPKASMNALLALEKIRRNIPSLPLEPFYGR